MLAAPSISRAALAALFATLLASPAVAGATDRYVSTDGTGTCASVSSPCQLEDALEAADDGDRILLGPGIHAPSGPLYDNADASEVSILAAPGEGRPVLDLSAGTLFLKHGTGLSGVDVLTDSGRAIYAAGGLLEGLRIQATGANTRGVELGNGAVLRNSTATASGLDSAAILAAAPTTPAEIRGVTAVASGADAAAVRVQPSWPSITARARVVNSIAQATGTAYAVFSYAPVLGTAAVALDHVAAEPSRLETQGSGATIVRTDTLLAEPLFVNQSSGDLRQTSVSPTIDAGTTDVDGDGDSDSADVLAGGMFDLDGSPRRLGDPDIGADEREMPPLVLAAQPTFSDFAATASLLIQPRGLVSDVSVEWRFDEGVRRTTTPVQVSGNAPVAIAVPMSAVPPGASTLSIKTRVSNSAGTTDGETPTVAVPVDQVPQPQVEAEATEPPVSTPGPTPSSSPAPAASLAAAPPSTLPPRNPTPTPTPGLRLPGALPSLVSTDAFQRRGTYTYRLWCRHTVSCRGTVLLTRLGAVRTDTFKIPPGAVRTVQIALTSDQTARVRKAGEGGLRGLLEVRSLDDGSTWTAVRFYSARWR